MSKDGGPAFPTGWVRDDKGNPSEAEAQRGGMSLRDYFAGQALAGVMAGLMSTKPGAEAEDGFIDQLVNDGPDAYIVASACWKLADTMLEDRNG